MEAPFFASNPGLPLRPFLMPGFQSFSVQQQQATQQINENSNRAAQPTIPAASRVLSNTQWAWIVGGAPILLVISVIFVANVFGGANRSSKTPVAKTAISLTICEKTMLTASREPDSTLAEPLIMKTTQLCGSKEEGIAAVQKFPGAMGMRDYTNAQAVQSWEIVSYNAPAAPAC